MHSRDFWKQYRIKITLGIYVHDRKLEILNPTDTIAKYKEYNKRYGTLPEKFEWEYYKRHKYERYKIEQANPAYLRKCIEAYGLDADKKLGKVPEYIWRADSE